MVTDSKRISGARPSTPVGGAKTKESDRCDLEQSPGVKFRFFERRFCVESRVREMPVMLEAHFAKVCATAELNPIEPGGLCKTRTVKKRFAVEAGLRKVPRPFEFRAGKVGPSA